MPNVETKSISQVRGQHYSQAMENGITAITLNGEFVGVLITCDSPVPAMAKLNHKRLLDNPVHTVTQLAKQVLG